MRKSYKLSIVVVLSLAVVLALGAGLAVAQSATGDQAAPAEQAMGPGGHGGPGGPGQAGGRRGLMKGGEVVSVDGDTVTLKTRGGEEESFTVNEETIYRTRDGEGSLADVVPGERIGVKFVSRPEEGQEGVAAVVLIGQPGRHGNRPVVGEVTAVDGNTVTINTGDGEQQFTIPSIEVGSRLGIAADNDGNVKGLMYDPPQRPPAPDEQSGPPAE